MTDQHIGTFFGQWIRHPREMGALFPSGGPLARAIAREAATCTDGVIVELGPGTGTVTEALLGAGIAPERLLLVERNPALIRVLNRNFPGLQVVEGDAAKLAEIARERGVTRLAAIVSGIPLLSIEPRKRYVILRQAFALLDDDAPFIQFTYGPAAPVPGRVIKRLGLEAKRAAFVLANVPPASVWRFRRGKR